MRSCRKSLTVSMGHRILSIPNLNHFNAVVPRSWLNDFNIWMTPSTLSDTSLSPSEMPTMTSIISAPSVSTVCFFSSRSSFLMFLSFFASLYAMTLLKKLNMGLIALIKIIAPVPNLPITGIPAIVAKMVSNTPRSAEAGSNHRSGSPLLLKHAVMPIACPNFLAIVPSTSSSPWPSFSAAMPALNASGTCTRTHRPSLDNPAVKRSVLDAIHCAFASAFVKSVAKPSALPTILAPVVSLAPLDLQSVLLANKVALRACAFRSASAFTFAAADFRNAVLSTASPRFSRPSETFSHATTNVV